MKIMICDIRRLECRHRDKTRKFSITTLALLFFEKLIWFHVKIAQWIERKTFLSSTHSMRISMNRKTDNCWTMRRKNQYWESALHGQRAAGGTCRRVAGGHLLTGLASSGPSHVVCCRRMGRCFDRTSVVTWSAAARWDCRPTAGQSESEMNRVIAAVCLLRGPAYW